MAGSVTVKDVARAAEVSIGTVSRVFNNHNNVTDEVRQRVLKAASDLGYFGPGTGGQDARVRETTRTIKEIGFLYYSNMDKTGFTANPFWSHILHGVEYEARKSNIKVTYRAIGDLYQTPQALLTTIYEMKLGGILLVGPAEADVVQLIRTTRLPLVLVDNYVSGLSVDAVLCDNFEGARMAVDYLISEEHRQIAFIGGPVQRGARPMNTVYTIERRAAGYRTALLDAGLSINYDLYKSSTLLNTEGGYEACKRLIEGGHLFSAIFCANDETAIGALKALREAGLHVPEDVSLIGFDDIDLVEHLTPALTTVRINKEALGSIAVKNLLMRTSDPDAVSFTSILEVELIKRDSVLAPKP